MSNENITNMAYNSNYVDFKDEFKSMLDNALGNAIRSKFGQEDESQEIEEKAVSQQQQKLMGIAYSIKKGETDPSDATEEARRIAKEMSMEDLKKYASTKHEGLPKKKN